MEQKTQLNEKLFLERIAELEEQLQDAYTLIDLQAEEIEEKKAAIRALKGQLQIVRQDRRYEITA